MERTLLPEHPGSIVDFNAVVDTLVLARELHPGQRNTLDALCKRYEIDNSNRELHGALLDARILADVYLAMTGGQTDLGLRFAASPARTDRLKAEHPGPRPAFRVLQPSEDELARHRSRLEAIREMSGRCLWLEIPE